MYRTTPLSIYILHAVGSSLFLIGSVWNIMHHPDAFNVYYIYAGGSASFLVAAVWNLYRKLTCR